MKRERYEEQREERWDFHTFTRICGIIILVLTVLYLLLAVLPFYGNGINLHSYQEIFGSAVDVKGYPPFNWFGWSWFGGPLEGIAMITAGYITVISPVLTPLIILLLTLRWNSFSRNERIIWLATSLMNILTLTLTWQAHRSIMAWLVD